MLALLGIPSPAGLAKDLVKDAFSLLAEVVGAGAERLLAAALAVIDSTTTPVFSSGWWNAHGTKLFAVTAVTGASVAVVAVMVAALESIWTGATTPVVKAVSALPGAILKTAALVPLTSLLVSGTDEISAGLIRLISPDLLVAPALLAEDLAATGFVGLVIAAVVVVAVLALWAELALRGALIYLVVMTAPLAIAASIHPRLRQVSTRLAELGVALVASKVLMALAVTVGFSELTVAGAHSFGQAVGALVAGVGTLGIAAFAPYVLFRLISVEIAHLEGLARRPARAAQQIGSAAASSRQSLTRHLSRPGGVATWAPAGWSASGGPQPSAGAAPGGGTGSHTGSAGRAGWFGAGEAAGAPVPPAPATPAARHRDLHGPAPDTSSGEEAGKGLR
jgi:hypothetical protein